MKITEQPAASAAIDPTETEPGQLYYYTLYGEYVLRLEAPAEQGRDAFASLTDGLLYDGYAGKLYPLRYTELVVSR